MGWKYLRNGDQAPVEASIHRSTQLTAVPRDFDLRPWQTKAPNGNISKRTREQRLERREATRGSDRLLEKERLFAKAQLREQFSILVNVLTLHVIEKLTTAAGHLEKSPTAMEVLAVGAQVIGQMVDAGSEQCDLDLGRAGILVVVLELCDGIRTNCGRHILLVFSRFTRLRRSLQIPCHPRRSRCQTRPTPASPFELRGETEPIVAKPLCRRDLTNAAKRRTFCTCSNGASSFFR